MIRKRTFNANLCTREFLSGISILRFVEFLEPPENGSLKEFYGCRDRECHKVGIEASEIYIPTKRREKREE